MTWKEFVKRWRPVELTRMGIPRSTVTDWQTGAKEPKGWTREAAEFWLSAKAPGPETEGKRVSRAKSEPP